MDRSDRSTGSDSANLEAALEYADRGWHVFPVGRGKAPLTRNGVKDATTDEGQIRRWWTQTPSANIGVATGAVSGVVVIDLDTKNDGVNSFKALLVGHDPVETLVSSTGGGGNHIWFEHPGFPIKNSAGKLGAGIDVRGDGGYVVAPPSHHASGKLYRWVSVETLAPIPAWLADLLRKSPAVRTQPRSDERRFVQNSSSYGLAALSDEAELLRHTTEGQRNDQLNQSAFRIGQLIGGGELDESHAEATLRAAALDTGLDRDSVEDTLRRALDAGKDSPRQSSRVVAARGANRPPVMAAAAYYGLAGEIVRAIEPHSESDPAALLMTLLTGVGAIIGRGPHMRVDSAEHPARLFVALVGDTSKARKGTSWNNVQRILRVADSDFVADQVLNGFGSGEALVDEVADPDVQNEGTEVDRRLLIQEPELARLLVAAGRQGSTLSMVVREAWDGGKLQARSRAKTSIATNAHIAAVTHITLTELRKSLTSTETANGFANRILFCSTHRSKLLPFGGDLDDDKVADLGQRLAIAIQRASRIGRMSWSTEARPRWEQLYKKMADDDPGGLLGAVTARAEAQVLRLSVTYALIDGSTEITLDQLEAAWAVWSYSRSSAAYIFGDTIGDPTAEKLLAAIRDAGPDGLDITAQFAVFANNIDGERLSAARQALEEAGRIVTRQEETGGRPRTVSRATEHDRGPTNVTN